MSSSNPDTTVKTNGGSSIMIFAFPTAILMVMIVILLFYLKDYFNDIFVYVLWIGIPFISFIITIIINFASQYSFCNNIDANKALLGSLPSVITIYIGIIIGSLSIFRVPIASVIVPFFTNNKMDITIGSKNIGLKNNQANTQCCSPQYTLEQIETTFPLIKAMSFGFYILFSTLFGIVIGNSIATIC